MSFKETLSATDLDQLNAAYAVVLDPVMGSALVGTITGDLTVTTYAAFFRLTGPRGRQWVRDPRARIFYSAGDYLRFLARRHSSKETM